jgi:hypothetical protein
METANRSPPAVPRTRRSTSDSMSRRLPGRRRAGGGPLLLHHVIEIRGREVAKCTGVRQRDVSTSLISSSPFSRLHWWPKGPARAERNVRSLPCWSKFSTGADGAVVEAEAGGAVGNHVGVCVAGGGSGSRVYAGRLPWPRTPADTRPFGDATRAQGGGGGGRPARAATGTRNKTVRPRRKKKLGNQWGTRAKATQKKETEEA